MWGKWIIAACSMAFISCPVFAQPIDMENKSLFVRVSSEALPNDIKMTISHGLGQEIFPEKSDYEISQANYNYLLYTFNFNSDLRIRARTYLDDIHNISIQNCFVGGATDQIKMSECMTQSEFRSAILTLLAFDYHVQFLGENGYEDVSLMGMNVTTKDILDWKQKMYASFSKGTK